MSTQNQNRTETLEAIQGSSVQYDDVTTFEAEELAGCAQPLSALEDLASKIELCLKKQQQVNFISREIADIVKKSS